VLDLGDKLFLELSLIVAELRDKLGVLFAILRMKV
jgi:hypothetical protein